jgi:hypothetical protein
VKNPAQPLRQFQGSFAAKRRKIPEGKRDSQGAYGRVAICRLAIQAFVAPLCGQ